MAEAKKYFRVKTSSLGGRNNLIFNGGDIITEGACSSTCEQLEADGYLTALTDEETTAHLAALKAIEDGTPAAEEAPAGNKTPAPLNYEELTKAELGVLLDKAGIAYNPKDNKPTLIALLNTPAIPTEAQLEADEDGGYDNGAPTINEISVRKLKATLTEKAVAFDDAADKPALYALAFPAETK